MSTPQRLQPLRFPLRGIQLIEASAGTGKTYSLAALYVRFVLAHGGETPGGRAFLPPDILVVTFTKAATEELRDRIRARLVEAAAVFRGQSAGDDFLQALRAEYSEDQFAGCAARLQMAAEWMDEAAIFTIHGWCQRMLSEHAFDSGMGFAQEMEHDLTELQLQAARDYWRTWLYPLQDSRVLDDLGALARAPEMLLKQVQPWLRPDGKLIAFHADGQPLPTSQRPDEMGEKLRTWYRQVDAAVAALTPHLDTSLLELLTELQASKLNKRSYSDAKWHEVDLPTWKRWLAHPDEIQILQTDDAEHLQRFNPEVLRSRLKKGHVLPAHPAFVSLDHLMTVLNDRPDAYRAVVQHAAQWIAGRIEQQKERRAVLGFDDLLTRLHHALDREGGAVLAERIRAQFPVAMVDEFQDTDPIQFSIFRAIYPQIDANEYSLTLVGDPKQAIYSFRGADLQTYLRARRWTTGRHFNLPRNFRSAQALVDAVNRLFVQGEALPKGSFGFRHDDSEDTSAIGQNALPYFPVEAQGQRATYVEHGEIIPMLNYWLAPEAAEQFKKSDYMDRMARVCADRIAKMLTDSDAKHCGLQSEGSLKALQPGSFAVLVRNRMEAKQIAEALAVRGVRTVYLSDRDSVYATEEAQTLLAWLQAIHAPEDEQKLRMALMMRLSMQNDAQFGVWLEDEQAWETMLEHCRDFQRIWRQQGVLPMIRAWLHTLALPSRWLALVEGERILTNMLHLAELLQRESAHRDGETGLMRWFATHVQAPSGTDEQIQRLESDASRVQIVTIHKSKGLQYDFVFLPFIASFKSASDAPLRYGQDDQTIVDIAPNETVKERADWERLLEDVRLLYVALTRAVYGCWLGLATFSEGNAKYSKLNRSALGYLLDLPDRPAPDDVRAALERLQWHEEPFPAAAMWQEVVSSAKPFPALVLSDHVTRERWWVASYSALRTRANAARLEAEQIGFAGTPDSARHAQLQDDDEMTAAQIALPLSSAPLDAADDGLHDFPRGASIGTFLHGLLEWACEEGFDKVAGAIDDQQNYLQKRLQQRGLEDFLPAVQHWLDRMLTTPLAFPGDHPIMSLATLPRAVSELEFWLEAKQVSVAQIDALAQQFFWPGVARPALEADTLNGMLKGFIDLTFIGSDGRYWVCDFKSNWLGADRSAYTQQSMQTAMLEKRYDVQATLYVFALHRLLKARVRDYEGNESKYLGGAMYWFMRDPSMGQLWLPTPHELVRALDTLFRAERSTTTMSEGAM